MKEENNLIHCIKESIILLKLLMIKHSIIIYYYLLGGRLATLQLSDDIREILQV